MSLKIVRLLINRISRNLEIFFKFDGVGKYQAKSRFFQEKLIGRKMLK